MAQREEAFDSWLEKLPKDEDGFYIIGGALVMPTEQELSSVRVSFNAGWAGAMKVRVSK